MQDKNQLLRALTRRDLKEVRRLLSAAPFGFDEARTLVLLVKHSACMIDVYGNEQSTGILRELASLIGDALSGADTEFMKEFALHVAEASVITLMFRQIKQAVNKLEISALSSAEQAWAVLNFTGSHLHIVIQKLLLPQEQTPLLTRAGANWIESDEGEIFDGDEILAGTEQFLRMTLCMLAHENGWWENGKLVLPYENNLVTGLLDQAGAHIYLASVWDLLLGASETLRFAGRALVMSQSSDGEGGKIVNSVKFDLALETHLFCAIARMRAMQMEMDVHMTAIGMPMPNFGDVDSEVVPLPPDGFVSFEELATYVAFDTIYHFDLSEGTDVKGLTPAVLSRGYAVLKRCFEQQFGAVDMTLTEVDSDRIARALRNCSLSEAEANRFLDIVTFGTDSRDFFDYPIIMTKDRKHILRAFSQFSSLPRIVISRLTSLRSTFENKGTRFELTVIDLFTRNALAAKAFTIMIGSDEYQYDCVLVWEQYVFIFECKNYSLPVLSSAQEFYFMESMEEAVDQVLRLTNALRRNASELHAHFTNVPAELTFVPVVLNAMPFAMDKQINGVYLYDYSALSRFMDGSVSMDQPIRTDEGWVKVKHVVRRLWADASPKPTDLIAQMRSPIQLEAEFPRWHEQEVGVRLNELTFMSMPILRKEAASSADLLKALGVSEEGAELMLQFSTQLHTELSQKG